MSSIPPSYEDATRRDPLSLIASYLDAADLARASRVSHDWYASLVPVLFGHPMRHFYNHEREQYSAVQVLESFASFLDIIHLCTPATRALVYAIHVPPDAQVPTSELCVKWREALRVLPNLQSLIASSTSSLDHHALHAISTAPVSSLRLLEARNCPNVTEKSLCRLLSASPRLYFLDLSYTKAARTAAVFGEIAHLRELRILRLRDVGLHIEGLKTYLPELCSWSDRFQARLRSIDLRDNALELGSLPMLRSHVPTAAAIREYYDGPLYEGIVRRHLLANNLHGQELRESEPEGLTHIYLSGNKNDSSTSISPLLVSVNIRVLDFAVDNVPAFRHPGAVDKVWAAVYKSRNTLASLRISVAMLMNFPTTSLSDSPPAYGAAVDPKSPSISEPGTQFASELFPALRMLTLTGIPPFTDDARLVKAIECLLLNYASTALAASGQAKYEVDQQVQRKPSKISARAPELCPTKEIRLELSNRPKGSSQRQSGQRQAAVDDPDAELLWAAAQDDFSFFENEKPRAKEPEKSEVEKPQAIGTKRSEVSKPEDRDSEDGSPPVPIDLVQYLAEWRAVRREAWERDTGTGASDLAAQFWPGKVTIVHGDRSSIISDLGDGFAWMHTEL